MDDEEICDVLILVYVREKVMLDKLLNIRTNYQ